MTTWKMRLFLAVAALACPAAARAGYLSTTGGIQILPSPPASVVVGALQSNTEIRTFAEKQDFTLTSAVKVDDTASGTFTADSQLVSGTIAKGMEVDSYYFHSDPKSSSEIYTGSVTFTTQILGVIVLTNSLDTTDAQLGASGTTYNPSSPDAARGLELGPNSDYFTLSADKLTLTFHFHTTGDRDDIRVLTAPTAVPEPGSIALLGLGGLLGLARLRRRSRPAKA